MTDRLYRCRRLVGSARCTFDGPEEAAAAHEAEFGHGRCGVESCRRFLHDDETRFCQRCITRTRDALVTIRDADLEPVLEAAAERSGTITANLLAMVATGNTDALRPYKPVTGSRPVDVPHGALVGQETCWLPYWEHRTAADGREHFADHRDWNDPLVPFAELDAIAVAWMGEGEQQEIPQMPVRDCCEFLLRRLWTAARMSDTFNDEAATLWRLAAQVANTAGLVNHPEVAPARCFDCGGSLISEYREPKAPIPDQGRRGMAWEGREMVPTEDGPDLPIWTCADCDLVYQPAEYWLALRAFLEAQAEAAG